MQILLFEVFISTITIFSFNDKLHQSERFVPNLQNILSSHSQ